MRVHELLPHPDWHSSSLHSRDARTQTTYPRTCQRRGLTVFLSHPQPPPDTVKCLLMWQLFRGEIQCYSNLSQL